MNILQMPDSSTRTRMHNLRTVTLVRAGWLTVFSISLIVLVGSIPYQFLALHAPCAANVCVAPSLTPEMSHNLEQAGISIEFYALYWIILESVVAVPFLLTSLVLFWRRSDDWLVVFIATWMASLPSALSIGLTEFARGHPFWQVLESIFWFIFAFFLILFLFLFPDGRFVPRWTQWLSIAVFLIMVGMVVLPGAPLNPETTLYAVSTHFTPTALIFFLALVVFIAVGIGCRCTVIAMSPHRNADSRQSGSFSVQQSQCPSGQYWNWSPLFY